MLKNDLQHLNENQGENSEYSLVTPAIFFPGDKLEESRRIFLIDLITKYDGNLR